MAAIDLDRIKSHGKQFLDGFTPGQKAMTILGVVAVVLAGSMFMSWASKPDYAPLYSGLSSQDAGAVTQQLDSQGVKYKLANGGGTILVARPDVYKTRIALSAKGVPAGGGDSFAKFDNQSITTDQFTRNVDYQRALQGELGKTIESIDNVQAASVTLTIPQDTVFVGATQDKPTAAVLVKSTGTLPDSTVTAIVHLVASTIPNMNPDDVTVADANGKVLHAPGMDTSAGGGAQVEAKQTYENAVKKKLEDMIAQTLGPGHAAVTVAADLDMSKAHSQSTTFTRPAGANNANVPAEQSSNQETLNQGGGNTTNGVLGPGNTGNNGAAANGTTQYQKNDTTQKNALDSTQITADTPPGTVKRMSVSVLLDSTVVPNATDVDNVWKPQIQSAAGIQASRDGANAVQVTAVKFNADAQKAAQKQLSAAGGGGGNPMMDLIKQFLTLLMIGVILFFAWRAIKRAEANRVPLRVPLDLLELEAPASAGATAALPSQLAPAAVGAGAARAPAPIEPPSPSVEQEITDLIERQPDEVAQTLRSWLADRRG